MASETKRAIDVPAMSVTSEIALARALAEADRTLGIVGHYPPGDGGRADGLRLELPDEPAWHRLASGARHFESIVDCRMHLMVSAD
jgi:hypothetical protein